LIHKLSKGYRQRVGIAQAVVHDPPVVILDEPSAGLDPAQRAETRGFIKSLARDHTVILSTHILPDVQEICSRVVIIHGGRVVADDTIDNLNGNADSSTRFALSLRHAPPDALQLLRQVPNVSDVRAEESEAQNESVYFITASLQDDVAAALARLC